MTANKMTLKVDKRDILGKKSKALRQKGLVLGNIMVPGQPSIPISIEANKLKKVYEDAGESTLVYLTLGEEKTERPTLFKEVVYHPTKHILFHVCLHQVNLNEEVEAAVPIEFVGEFKVQGGVLLKVKDSVDVRALPTNLPENFIIDVSQLKEIDQSVSLLDLQIDKSKVEFVLSEDSKPEDVILALVQEERVAEPEETAEVEEVEGEVGKEGAAGTAGGNGNNGEAAADKSSDKKE